jgi:hypothetical protein
MASAALSLPQLRGARGLISRALISRGFDLEANGRLKRRAKAPRQRGKCLAPTARCVARRLFCKVGEHGVGPGKGMAAAPRDRSQ